MKARLLFLILFLPFCISAQTFRMDGKIKGIDVHKIKISNFYGNEDRIIDSVSVDKDGVFRYVFPKDFTPGMYRLRFGKDQFIDIIYNHENIRFSTDAVALIDSLVFRESLENQLYFEYLNRRNLKEYKIELLGPLLTYYPQDDDFYEDVEKKYDVINTGFKSFMNTLIKENPQTFVSRVIKMDYTPDPPKELDPMAKMQYMRAHFFDNMDFSDTSMLYTNIISGKVIQYLSFYQNNRMSKDQLQVEFIKAVNVIMDVTSVNQLVYEYTLDYLIGGFESYGFEKVITYIADNINLDETCVNSERKAELEKKVESLKKFSVGQKAPDFTTTDLDGNKVTLSAMDSEYTLLVFWATWCPHCVKLIPDLSKIYLPGNKDKLEIVSVSLDESKEELGKFLAEGNYNWTNIADFKKWQGEVVQKYDIYATPTMLLVYKDLTIVAKPMTYDEVKNALYERNILH